MIDKDFYKNIIWEIFGLVFVSAIPLIFFGVVGLISVDEWDGWSWFVMLCIVLFGYLKFLPYILLFVDIIQDSIQQRKKALSLLNTFLKEKEKYEEEKKKVKEEYINYVIENPQMLDEYYNIISRIEDDYNVDFISKQNFKILFWNFLNGKLDGELELFIYESKIYWWNNEEVLNVCENIKLNDGNTVKFELIKSFIFEVYEKAKRFQSDINKIKEFEKNEELMQIWFNLSRKYNESLAFFGDIEEKIYFLYDELYKDASNVKFSYDDIVFILSHHRFKDESKRDLLIDKLENKKIDTIRSKSQFIEIFIREYKKYCNDEIEMIAIVLKTQKNICMSTKMDIVENIDDIVNEIYTQRQAEKRAKEEKDRKEKAIKEREKLLK